jgi:mRNA-degrading endonuclease RelE of RelBE toxin-antitoxin system
MRYGFEMKPFLTHLTHNGSKGIADPHPWIDHGKTRSAHNRHVGRARASPYRIS